MAMLLPSCGAPEEPSALLESASRPGGQGPRQWQALIAGSDGFRIEDRAAGASAGLDLLFPIQGKML
ncbi:MAG: hypothetical protein U0359_08065 [Byssovorax sp.]